MYKMLRVYYPKGIYKDFILKKYPLHRVNLVTIIPKQNCNFANKQT